MTLYKTLENPALVKALAHPLRAKMLYALQDRASSPKELSAHFEVPLSNVAYHIQVLRKLKLIRLVKKTPRRGAIEHHYMVDPVVSIDADAWGQTPDVIKEHAVAGWLEDIGSYVTEAAQLGGFNRGNAHLTRSRLVLDEEGWDVLAAKLLEVVDLVDELRETCAERLKKSNHEGERATGLVMMLFDSAPSVPGANEANAPAPSTVHHDGERSHREPAGRGASH
jgi:DNA-binding transcriptional ArsR family regulator